MRNTLTDLNDYLFEQVERLSDDDLSPEELEKEMKRTKALTSVATNIIGNASVMLDAAKHTTEYSRAPLPAVIGLENNDK